jgi:3-dehydroquinate synthase
MAVRSLFGDYRVELAESQDFVGELAALPQTFVVVDENVWRCHGDGVLRALADAGVHVLPISEERKVLASVEELYEAMTGRAAKRNTTVISIGGGITQDLTGFLASTIYRGVPWVFVPTTLLAQADSCIGSKTSLNFRHFKNLIGTLYPPERVIVYPGFVATQEEEDYFSGLGEVVKLHLIGGEEAAGVYAREARALASRRPAAVRDAVWRCLEIKRAFIEEDERDTGRRRWLNFGHCFGHALESASDFALPHGQAVVAGMMLAGRVARLRGRLSAAMEERLRREILRPALIVPPDRLALDAGAVIAAMRQDKKRTGPKLALVMLCDGFTMNVVDDLDEDEVVRALAELQEVL